MSNDRRPSRCDQNGTTHLPDPGVLCGRRSAAPDSIEETWEAERGPVSKVDARSDAWAQISLEQGTFVCWFAGLLFPIS